MRSTIAKALIMATSLTIAIPPAQAARLGSSRSSGRQSQMARQAPAPSNLPPSSARPASPYNNPAAVPRQAPGPYAPSGPYGNAPVQQPGMARQGVPPAYPNMPPARQQGGSTAGSMLGGALLGLGLGSLMSRGSQPSVTTNSDGTVAEQGVRESSGGGWLWLILIAAAVFFLIRRMRR